jgi:hypothetical protein
MISVARHKGNAPTPEDTNSPTDVDKGIAAQELLRQHPTCHGWVRRKGAVHGVSDMVASKLKFNPMQPIASFMSWNQHYAIMVGGNLYIYNHETATHAKKVLILSNYQRFVHLKDELKDVTWPFQLIKREDVQGAKLKDEFFSVTSEYELQRWEEALKQQLQNNVPDRRKKKKSMAMADYDENEYTRPDEDVYVDAEDVDDEDSDTKQNSDEDAEYVDVNGGYSPMDAGSKHAAESKRPLPAKPDEQQRNGRRALPSLPQDSRPKSAQQPSFVNRETEKTLPPKPAVRSPGSNGRPVPVPPKIVDEKPPSTDGRSGSRPAPAPPPPLSPEVKDAPTSPINRSSAAGKPPVLTRKPRMDPQVPPSPSPRPVPEKPQTPNKPVKPPALPTLRKSTPTAAPPPPPPVDTDDLVYELGSIADAAMWSGTADEAQTFMRGNGLADGVFLIRKSSDSCGYSLLVICRGAPCKFKIDEDPQTKSVKMASMTYDSLLTLIMHFTETNLPNKTTPLTKPYSHV